VTITVPVSIALRLRADASAGRRSVSSIVREALEAYLAGVEPPPTPAFVGMGDSGLGDLGARAEDYLEGFGEDRS
jgi:hypothetical protein